MKQKTKQLILTLALLITAATGAWADETPLLTIEGKDYANFTSGSKTFDDKVTVTFSNEVYNDGDEYGWYAAGGTPSLLTVAGINGYTITSCKFYTSDGPAADGYTVEAESPSVYLSQGYVYTDDSKSVNKGSLGIKKIEVYGGVASAPSGPEVAWNAAENSGSFTMPAGNVTLEPDYYPQAVLATGGAPTAINDVPATTDGAIVNAGTVANIGETTNAQGTVMYYVSQTEMTDADLLALAADKWTANVPTAESLAEGPAYVYYYVRGNDSNNDAENFSDGDILAANALTVTIAAAPTYAVTFADDLAEPDKWTASPAADVKKGQTVTVTYTGTKKVIGVKAEKKAKVTYPLLSAVTTEDIGKVVCAEGHLHEAKTAVPDGCTAVGILGKVTDTGHGLILALQNAAQQEWNTINGWTSVTTYAGTTLKVLPDDGARSTNLASYTTLGNTNVSNWAVAQKSDYDAIFQNLGSTINDDGYTYDGNVNAYITTGVGGTAIFERYWSATDYDDEDEDEKAWHFCDGWWNGRNKMNSYNVRPVLGF